MISKHTLGVCLEPWESDVKDDRVTFQLYDTVHSIPKYTVVIDQSMKVTFFAFNWPIPHDHQTTMNANTQ